MKLNHSTKVIVAVLTIILGAGFWIAFTPCPAFENQEEVPDYLEDIWPPPQTELHLGCYIRKSVFDNLQEAGFSVVINTDGIYELELSQSGYNDASPFQDRVSLYMDGEKVSVDRYGSGGGVWFDSQDVEQDLAGWYFLGSSKLLFFGKHTAKVIITTRSGQNLEYEWQFKIK